MHEQEALKEPELRKGEVRGKHGLATLLTTDTNANVRSLNHADVISAVANRKSDDILRLLDELDEERLLQGCDTARNDGAALRGEANKLRLDVLIEAVDKARSVDDACARLLDQCNTLQIGADLLQRLVLCGCVDDEEIHVVCEEAAGIPNVDRSLLLVSRQHPNLDICLGEVGNGLGDAGLQFVLDGRCAQKNETVLNLRSNLLDLTLAFVHRDERSAVLCIPGGVLGVGDHAARKHKRSQTVRGKGAEMHTGDALQFVVFRGEAFVDHRVGALGEQQILPAGVPQDHRHALAVAVKLDNMQQLIHNRLPAVHNRHLPRTRPLELKPKLPRGGHERTLVGRLRMVHNLPRLRIGVRKRSVAQRQQAEKLRRLRIAALDRAQKLLVPEYFSASADHLSRLLRRLRRNLRRNTRRRRLCSRLVRAVVHNAPNCALDKRHDIARERARLVGKHILNHAELLAQRRRAAVRRRVRVLIVHKHIPVDEKALPNADELERYVEGNGHERVQEHNKRHKLDHAHFTRRVVRAVVRQIVNKVNTDAILPHRRQNGREDT
eukprot:Opistho-2@34839